LLAFAVHAEHGSTGEITFGGLRSVVPPTARGQVHAPCATDGSRECAAPAGYKKTSLLDQKTVRAS
jgi:hypothetical protein